MHPKLNRFLVLLLLVLYVASMILALTPPSTAAAQATTPPPTASLSDLQNAQYTFINYYDIEMTFGSGSSQQTIEFDNPTINSTLLTDPSSTLELDYSAVGGLACDGHNSVITVHTKSTLSSTPPPVLKDATIAFRYVPSHQVGAQCKSFYNNLAPITISQPGNFNIHFTESSDGKKITQSAGTSTFDQQPAHPNVYVIENPKSSSCPDYIAVSADFTTYTLYEMQDSGNPKPPSNTVPPNDFEASNCNLAGGLTLNQNDNVVITGALLNGNGIRVVTRKDYDPNKVAPENGEYTIGAYSTIQLPLGQATQATPPIALGQNAAGTSNGITCTNTFGLGWVICPIINLLSDTADTLNNAVIEQLNVNVNEYFPPDCSNGACVEKIWSSIRDISLGLLIVVALFMVISQAIGVGPFDAYTVRKILPRILMAVILITLSWPLGRFFVQMSNDVGGNVQSLIYHIGNVQQINVGGGTGIATTLLTVGGAVFLPSSGLLLSLLATAVLSLIIGLLVLVFRRLIIVACVLAAPLAIIDHILPGPDRLWKIWKDSFIGALVAFPIITGAIALGAVLATIQSKVGGAGIVSNIVVFALYFGPYLLLPAILRMAGGAVSTLTGAANDRSRGVFDSLKKGRQTMRAKNTQELRAGEKFNNRALNALTSRASTRNFGFGGRGRAAYNQKMDLAAAEFAKSSGGMAMQHNDPGLRAKTYGSSQEARAHMARDFSLYKDVNGKATWDISQATEASKLEADTTVAKGIAAAQASGGFGRNQQVWAAQQLSNTTTGYDSIEQVAQTIARVSHGNENQMDSLAGNINSSTKVAGRPDLAPGVTTLANLAKAEAGLGPVRAGAGLYEGAKLEATGSMDGISVMRGKPAAVRMIASSLQASVNRKGADPKAVETSTRKLHEMINGMSYGSSPAQEELITAVKATQSVELNTHLDNALKMIEQGRSTDPNALGIVTGSTGGPGAPTPAAGP